MNATIRLMTTDDFLPVRRLVVRYLRETYDAGGDFQPTLENAAVFAQYGVQGAAAGDPCLVADLDGTLVGFIIARGVFFPGMETRDTTIRSWGSYVLPAHRGKRYAVSLFVVMARLAWRRGYTRLLGFTHGDEHKRNALRVVKHLTNLKEVGTVLMAQFEAPTDDTRTPRLRQDDAAARMVNGTPVLVEEVQA